MENSTVNNVIQWSMPIDQSLVTLAVPRDQTNDGHMALDLPSDQTNNGYESDLPGAASFLPWNNPDNLMTLEQYLMTAKVTDCVLSPLLLLVGTPTNLVSCAVFYKQGLRDRMNLCLFVLALADTTLLVSPFIVSLNSFVAIWDEEQARKFHAEVLVNVGWVMFGSKAVSGCISMVVAIERCVCVVFPLRANSIMRTRTMGALLATISVLCTLAASIAFFRNRVVSVLDPTSGQTYYMLVITDFFIKYKIIYDIIYDIFLNFALPIVNLVVVGVATAITVIKLRTAMAWRASTSSGRPGNHSQQKQAALTKMLVILSCVFMACSAPLTALSIVRLLVPDYSAFGRYSNFFFASHVVCTRVINPLNSAVNFFVYYWRCRRFRRDLSALCCRRVQTKRTSNGSPASCGKGASPRETAAKQVLSDVVFIPTSQSHSD